ISAMRCLALIVDAVGSLDKIRALLRVTVYVKSTADFVDQHSVHLYQPASYCQHLPNASAALAAQR
ncbi:hypothetical protein, partial [Streptomyces griseorubiginosus]|uniref:hypothetical protein n=1 Tax=Streptomyces griseorubiginosus TaxID=67304 RepID=UPI003414A01D